MLKNDRVYCDRVECTHVYKPPLSLAKLYTHDAIEISFVERGAGIHQIANRSLPCTQGDVYVICQNVPHGYFLASKQDELHIRRIRFDIGDWFDGEVAVPDSDRFCYGIFSDNEQCAYAMLNAGTQEKVNALFDVIEGELEGKGDEWRDCVKANLMMLLITLGRYVNGAIKNIPAIPLKEWRKVTLTLQIISERFGDGDLTLADIAQELFLSQSQISRLFKNLTGRSFSEYLREVRLSRACKLLCETELHVDEIIKRCGFKDITSFYQNFHKHVGMTPAQYRSEKRKGESVGQAPSREEKKNALLLEISECLQQGKAKALTGAVRTAIEGGYTPEEILEKGLLHGMNIIGERFKNNEVYVPEVLVAARAMHMGVQLLKPLLAEKGAYVKGKVCLGTVQGDLHDIGKNLVRMMMEGKGLEVIDLGVDVPPEAFVKAAIEQNCQVIACSALLTTTVGVMRDIVKLAEEKGIRDKVKIMIGGAPTSEALCRSIGADRYTDDAACAAIAAVELCREALGEQPVCQNKDEIK